MYGEWLGLAGVYDVNAPPDRKYAKELNSTLDAQLGVAGRVLGAEQKYQPLYGALALSGRDLATQGGIDSTKRFSPDIQSVLRSYFPQASGIMDTLGTQAQTQLAQNGALDPAMQRRVQQNVRGSQAARGLGNGPGDAAMEDYYTTQTQEQRRSANQAFAGTVAAQQQNFYGDPFVRSLGMPQPQPVNRLFNPESNYAQDVYNTNYNARAAANIATANNKAAVSGDGY